MMNDPNVGGIYAGEIHGSRADGVVTHAAVFDRAAALRRTVIAALSLPLCSRLRRPNLRRLRRRPPCSKPSCSSWIGSWVSGDSWVGGCGERLPRLPRRDGPFHGGCTPRLACCSFAALTHNCDSVSAVSVSESDSGSAAAPPPPPPPPRASSSCGALLPSQSSDAPPQPRPTPPPATPRLTPSPLLVSVGG